MTNALAALFTLLLGAPDEPKGEGAATPELHKIYVPYEKLDEVLGTDRERVMVPYKEFLELWNLKYGPKRAPDAPPVPYTVESAAYDGRLKDGIASFQATLEIEVFEEGWHRIPLAFDRVAFEEVLVDGQPGVLVAAKKGYELIVRGKGRKRVGARFVAGIARAKELASCGFGLPPIPLQRLAFRVPGKGTEVGIEPARAHTVSTEGDETLVLAFLGARGDVKLTWRYKPEEIEKEPPLLFANDTVDVRVEERVLRGDARIGIEVLRAPAQEFTIRVPERAQVLEVEGEAIRTWGFLDATRRQLRVTLHKEVSGAYALRIGFEAPIEVPGPVSVPWFQLEGAARERGHLRVTSAEGVGVRASQTENVFQVDLQALPEPIRGGDRAIGYRFPSLPCALGLSTERILPRVSVTTRARYVVERRRLKAIHELRFRVERTGLFQLVLEAPPGLSITDVGAPDLVDGWREAVEGDRRLLVVDLKGRRIGEFALGIVAEAAVEMEKGSLATPLFRVVGVEREEGTLGVFMDPGIQAKPKSSALVPIEPERLAAEDEFRPPAGVAWSVFGWRWRGPGADASFEVEPRKPKVTCETRYDLHGEEGRVRVQAQLLYRVEYTEVESFSFRVPKRIVDRLKVEGPNVREKPSADDPAEEGKEPTATYRVTLQGAVLGEVALSLEYDEVFPEALRTNEQRDVRIPAILPLEVERGTTYVSVRRSPVLKIETSGGDYEQIDPSELPRPGEDTVLALRRFDHPKEFALNLKKHEYQPVADLVVRHVHLETVLASGDMATTTAWFEVLNNDRQFLAVRLPEGALVQELQVQGKPEKPRTGAAGVLLVPLLTGQGKSAAFQVAIAYKHRVAASGGLVSSVRIQGPALPAFEESPAPFQALLTWRVHYPKAWRIHGFGGNVEPSGRDADRGSWLARAIEAFAGLVRVQPSSDGAEIARPVGAPRDIVPMSKERESVFTVFANGAGDGVVEIRHTSLPARVFLVVLLAAAGAAAVWFLARKIPPLRAGAAAAVVALLFLASASRGWVPLWNGFLAGAILAGIVRALLERRQVGS